MNKKTTYIDKYIGKKLYFYRKVKGYSQKALGEKLDTPVSFQQIQKYENGTNRISVSRLHQLAKLLDVRINDFFHE